MTATVDRQVRIITDTETADDDALTVGAVRELADGMNNYKGLVSGLPLITSCSPIDVSGHGYESAWQTNNVTTTEDLFHRFAPRPMPHGYDEIHFQIAGAMITGSSGTATFKLYASGRPYSGPLFDFDTYKLGGVWSVSSGIVINSTTHMIPAGVTDLEPVRNYAGLIHLTLTVQKTVNSDQCKLSSIMATAKASV